MRAIRAALAATSILFLPAASLSPAERIAQAKDIPVEEWTAMAMGRTLTYRIDGELWAFEHYHPGTDRVTLQLYDGTCMEGRWDYTAPVYCFHWEGQEESCFRHARLGAEIIVIENRGGADTPMTQEMTQVSDMPLACGPAVIS
jgi:hypothetical protein